MEHTTAFAGFCKRAVGKESKDESMCKQTGWTPLQKWLEAWQHKVGLTLKVQR